MKHFSLFLFISFSWIVACNAPDAASKNPSALTNKTDSLTNTAAQKDSVPECCQSNIPPRFAMGKKMDSAMNQPATP